MASKQSSTVPIDHLIKEHLWALCKTHYYDEKLEFGVKVLSFEKLNFD
jgi:hypothetical protein